MIRLGTRLSRPRYIAELATCRSAKLPRSRLLSNARKLSMSQITTMNPATGETLNTYELMSEAEAFGKIEAAHEAFLDWRTKSHEERAPYLRKIADVLRSNANRFAELMTREMGKLLRDGKTEVELFDVEPDLFLGRRAEILGVEVDDIEVLEVRGRLVPMNRVPHRAEDRACPCPVPGLERFEQSHRAIATTRAQDRVDVFTIKRMLERLEALAISACEVTSRGGSRERLLEYDGLQAPGAQLLETLLEVVFEHGACGGEDRDARSML